MTFFTDIAINIVNALTSLGRFENSDQQLSTFESMTIIAEEVITPLRYLRAIAKYQDKALSVTLTEATVSFQITRVTDADLYTTTATGITVIEDGGYALQCSVAIDGGAAGTEVRVRPRLNGAVVPGTTIYLGTEGGRQSASTIHIPLELVDGDEITISIQRLDGGGGTLATIPDGTSIALYRLTP